VIPSLGTHFHARVDAATLDAIAMFGFGWARIDAQVASVELLADMIDETADAGLRPLPIVYDLERLELVAAHAAVTDTEWGNEPDGDILPALYREQLEPACSLAAAYGLRLWAPAISNLDRDSLRWLELVRADGWPAGLHGVSVHRYGDGTFEMPHDGFSSRADEVRRLKELCDGLPFSCTEFGYPTKGSAGTLHKRGKYLRPGFHLSEDQQAANIAKEWQFWQAQGCEICALYQINDGPNADEGYGIRRCLPDGTLTDWKPAAYQVPQAPTNGGDPMAVTANTVFAREDLVEVPGRPGEFGIRCPPGAETILSPKTSGNHETRDMGALGGPDETCKVAGDLVYFPMNSQGGRFAWRLVD